LQDISTTLIAINDFDDHIRTSPAHTLPNMADDGGKQTGVIIGTSIVTLITGYMVGLYSSRGYIISPSLAEERRRYRNDPVESEESDIDEEDLANMDHAPNWANGPEADKKQGLRYTSRPEVTDTGEECKLVLVVRTDLGMTKGKSHCRILRPHSAYGKQADQDVLQARSQLNAGTQPSPATRPSQKLPRVHLKLPRFSVAGKT
jgi:hypothetical protein